jgi:hypothetical protein
LLLASPWSYWQSLTLLDLGAITIVTLVTLVSIRRVPFNFTLLTVAIVYSAVALPIVVFPDIYLSGARYVLGAAPFFVLLGLYSTRYRLVEWLLMSAGFSLQAAIATFFFSRGWVG